MTKTSASEAGVIFIQGSKLDEFKTKKIEGDNLTLKVDDSFQYGQQKDQSHRFLVYHDKGNKPYQVVIQWTRIISIPLTIICSIDSLRTPSLVWAGRGPNSSPAWASPISARSKTSSSTLLVNI